MRVLVVARERTFVDVPASADVRWVDQDVFSVAVRWIPDVVVLDARHAPSATAVTAELRNDFRTSHVPIVHVVDSLPRTLGAGDDYVRWSNVGDELTMRIGLAVRRSRERLARNPLSDLPGNRALVAEIVARQARGEPFACLYIDIDAFKAFNDTHGFVHGDQVIVGLARSITAALEGSGPGECFIAHLGGDDFVILVPPEMTDRLAGIEAEGCTVSVGTVDRADLLTDAHSVALAAAVAKAAAKRARLRENPA